MHPLALARDLVWKFALPSGDRQMVLDVLDRWCEAAEDQDVRQCRDCQTTWYLGEVEREYYASRGLCEPVRCRPCRDVRRAAAGRRA